ncbi:MAG TPA: hypothetical protein VKR61_20245 [Bryobacteraceae bacterium]|nr:hypothetical protein [Bryobacteraceae bacterium]
MSALLAMGLCAPCWGARCTTVLDPAILREYQDYVARVRQAAASRNPVELWWVPQSESAEAAARLASGKVVRSNISDAALNRRIARQNGTVIHWIGAVRIRGTTLAALKSVLEDYSRYDRIYRPLIFDCKAERAAEGPPAAYHVTFGLHSAYRFASIFLQHYTFRVDARIEHSGINPPDAPELRVYLAANEIRESDSGVPGRHDLLARYHDHGIMWDMTAFWRALPSGPDVYLEFETITLARSVESFACNLGIIPVPRSVVAAAMDSLPAQSVETILQGTKAECERAVARPAREASVP